MKICITSSGPGLDAEMEPRFGRCPYFLFIDPQTMLFEAVENPNIGAAGGAGIQSAQLVANKGVEALITGQVGPNAFAALQAAGIKVFTGGAGKVRELAEKFKNGRLSSFAQGPTVQAHIGMGMGGGRGRGMGRGMGRGFQPPAPSPPVVESPGEELKTLKEESQRLKEQLERITERIENLETKK